MKHSLILVSSSFAYSLEKQAWEPFVKYEEQKKDPELPHLCPLPLAGGGLFWAGREDLGFLFGLGELAIGAYTIKHYDDGDQQTLARVIFLSGVKIADIVLAVNQTEDYNRKLRQSLAANLSYSPYRGTIITARYTF